LVLILLIRIGVLTVQKLRSSRRFVLVILMVSAALITPGGDPVSLCILTIPLYFLFEISILVGILIERKKASSEAENSKSSGIAGSLILLFSLVILGSAGGWLYMNWDKAESIFLNLPPKASPKPNLPQSPRTLQTPITKEEFIIELTPIINSKENNQSNFPETGTYRASVKR
jgi:hypothetical protein